MKTKNNSSSMRYWPLFCLLFITLLGATALNISHEYNFHSFMHYFMGLFLLIFAMLKLFNPSQFADGFQMYDLLAKHLRLYAYIYPILELILALLYLSFLWPTITYTFTFILMAFSAIGVVNALRKGLDVRCACMGTVLSVPLSSVTLTEDISMGLMALIMLITTI